ncbi:MAG: CpsD/CapB family tyrosine-protein kinase [Clostridiales bacterium]|jgi:capsular exopolysaccharide synthesis family protein|nr:CpsD/CapB family tyrosine-protein kinase [Clostridiales bacterium]
MISILKREPSPSIEDRAKNSFKPNFEYEEAYRTARTNLMFSITKNGCKKVAVTSSESGEGKTTTAVNLAYMLAIQTDTKVLLIDCDLRKSQVHEYFQYKSSPGLADYLINAAALDDLFRHDNVSGLSVVCGGRIPPNPGEILSSPIFESFLTKMENQYNYILIDTPSVNAVTDGLYVIKLCDGVVLSVVQGMSLHDEFSKSLHIINGVGTKVLGVVMHGVEKKRNGGYAYA